MTSTFTGPSRADITSAKNTNEPTNNIRTNVDGNDGATDETNTGRCGKHECGLIQQAMLLTSPIHGRVTN